MAEKRDYYEVLGVDKGADDATIKRAFKRLAIKYHPDRNKDPGAGDKFREINEAYQVLSDPQKRAAYDQYGFAGADGSVVVIHSAVVVSAALISVIFSVMLSLISSVVVAVLVLVTRDHVKLEVVISELS